MRKWEKILNLIFYFVTVKYFISNVCFTFNNKVSERSQIDYSNFGRHQLVLSLNSFEPICPEKLDFCLIIQEYFGHLKYVPILEKCSKYIHKWLSQLMHHNYSLVELILFGDFNFQQILKCLHSPVKTWFVLGFFSRRGIPIRLFPT